MATRNRQQYGRIRKNLRTTWKRYVEAGGVVCWRCREPIPPGAAWDLGHMQDGGRHPEHQRCNRAAGGQIGGAIRAPQMRTRPPLTASKLPLETRSGPTYPTSSPFWRIDPALAARDPEPTNRVDRWSIHQAGAEFNPRCPDCRQRDSACDTALRRLAEETDSPEAA